MDMKACWDGRYKRSKQCYCVLSRVSCLYQQCQNKLFLCSQSSIVQHLYRWVLSTVSTIWMGVHLVFEMFYSNQREKYGRRKAFQIQIAFPLGRGERGSSGIWNACIDSVDIALSLLSVFNSKTSILDELYWQCWQYSFSNTNSLPSWQGREATLCRVFTPHSTLYKVLCKSHKHQCRQCQQT